MKKIIICVGVLLTHNLIAQTTDPPPTSVSNPMDNIKQLYPAAPTANNLMKFEEVPVSNYTGIPDIKIPIASIPANNQIAINVSLNYHPLNAKPDDKSSEVGLGWSVFAGGSITRTVRSGPDHTTIVSAPGAQPTIGIYFDEYTSRFQDKNYTRKYLDALATGTGIGTPTNEFKKLFYESTFLNRYDTEYDLYQYNFMGYTGRFIVKKDSNNQLFVEILDKNNLRVTISALNPANNLEATAFIITDEQGNKYSFDILEKSTRSILSNKLGFKGHNSTNVSDLGTINSSFHLSRITNTSDIELVKFNYYPAQQIFYTDTSEIIRSMDFPLSPELVRFDSEIPAIKENNITSTNTDVRSLQNIEIAGKGKINFTYLQGREDSNFINPQQLQKLDKISITDFSGKTIESYQFDYDYFTYRLLGKDMDDKRLSLTKITKYNSASVKEFDYGFNYNQNNSGLSLGKDHWDWFNCVKPTDNYLLAKEPSSACATVNILKNIKLPSGGTRAFDFGSNTYSYIADQPIDPYQNPDNWESSDKEVTYLKTESNTRKSFFTLSSSQTVELQCLVNQILTKPWNISIYKKVGSNYEHVTSIGPATEADPNYPSYHTRDMDAGEYYIVFNGDFTGNYSGTVNFIATYKDKKTSNLSQYLLGGGVRINNISYYDKITDSAPSKKIIFSYDDVFSSAKSSGALVFPKPVHSYKYNYHNSYVYQCTSAVNCIQYFENNFTIFSSENFIPVQKTQGADVGYQRVAVSETGKGENIFTYKSPIDTPNPDQISPDFPPFTPIPNYDYKRGLLIEEQKKDNNNTILFRKNNQYNIYDSEKLTGINLRHVNSPSTEYIYAGRLKTYEAYISACTVNPIAYCASSNDPSGLTAVTTLREIVGKANPNHSESTEYFNGKTFKTIEDITFNTRDYPIKQVMDILI